MRKSLSTIAVSLLVVLTAMSAMAAGDGSTTSAPAGVVNINSADAAQLSLLPRIGPKAAERIVEYRKANGNFKKTSDLMQVKGIGGQRCSLSQQVTENSIHSTGWKCLKMPGNTHIPHAERV